MKKFCAIPMLVCLLSFTNPTMASNNPRSLWDMLFGKPEPRPKTMMCSNIKRRNLASSNDRLAHAFETCHVSCKSDSPEELAKGDIGGVVLYGYDGKYDWHKNGVHAKSCYIIMKRISSLANIHSNVGMIHGKVYKSVFDEDPNINVVGSGFARKNGNWRFNSASFNGNVDQFRTTDKTMNLTEQALLEPMLKAYINTGKRDFDVNKEVGLYYVPGSNNRPLEKNP